MESPFLNQVWTALQGYFEALDFGRLGEILSYQPQAPMLFSSGLFFVLFLFFLPIYRFLRYKRMARIIYVVLFSLYFYYKCSGFYVLLLVGMVTSDFLIGKAIANAETKQLKKYWVALSLVINLGILGFFKYFNFLADMVLNLGGMLGGLFGITEWSNIVWRELPIFLPVGISFFTFQTISYIIDLYRGEVKPLKRWSDYLFYVSFFPQLVAGPIVRACDFVPQINRTPQLSRGDYGRALFLIMIGLFKKAVISDYISLNFVDRVFDSPTLYSGVENVLAFYGYALQIYCDFSGYSDIAIGIALFLGFRFKMNFDVPYNAATITEFWHRWHISLSTWLKDYLYIPLGGNRRNKVRTYINLIVTMLLGGLWHGAAWQFILWGALHGVALAIHKGCLALFPRAKKTGREMKPIWRFLGILFTFHFAVFAFIFFRAKDIPTAWEMFQQVAYSFHPEVFLQFVDGYRLVFSFMVLGFVLHFLPRQVRRGASRALTRSHFIVQLFLLSALVFIVFQVKSADVQPFIYFQF